MLARKDNIPLRSVAVKMHGVLDRANQRRTDVRTLNSVAMDFTLSGVDDAQGQVLVEGCRRL